jgi:tRNA(Arg) A34 adenosine deaminase TadA
MHSVVHAEVNALMFRNCVDLEGCTLYTTLFPCLDCAKTIIQSGIKTLYYLADPVDHIDKTGENEWDDKKMDKAWKQLQKDRPEKTTFVASRFLLQEHNYKSKSKLHRRSNQGRCCKRYRPSKPFSVRLLQKKKKRSRYRANR